MNTALELPPQWLAVLTEAVARQIDEKDTWVTVEGLAKRIGCEPSHIYDLRQRGLPARRFDADGRKSKRLHFNLREVWAWFAEETVPA